MFIDLLDTPAADNPCSGCEAILIHLFNLAFHCSVFGTVFLADGFC